MKKKLHFTLVELTISLVVFTIIVLMISTFYSSTISATSETNKKSMMFENARIAMDLITRDIQCIYYEYNKVPFWHESESKLAFVSAVSNKPDDAKSSLCEVRYEYDVSDDSDCWLKRSVQGDGKKADPENPSPKYDYYNKMNVSVFASDSSEDYRNVIPYVTSLTFTCYDETGSLLATGGSQDLTEFPFSVQITFTLMDKNSWKKWVEIGRDITFRKNHERRFTKAVFIGDRG